MILKTLDELCTLTKGITGIQKAIPGEYPLVATSENRKSHNEFQFDDEAVIVPLVSGTGHGHASIKRIHYQNGKFALGTILCAIIPKDKSILNAEYLFRFLNLNKENELVARMRGMANVTLPIKEIAKIEIPLPSLADQLAFVEQYKSLESDSQDIDFELSSQLSLVKQLRQSFLGEAMQGKLQSAPSPREGAGGEAETGQQLLARIKVEKAQLIKDKQLKKEKELQPFKTEEIPFEIPVNWVWCRLGDIIRSCQAGLEKDRHKQSLDFKIQYFKMNDIQEFGKCSLQKLARIDATDFEVDKYSLSRNDFLFNTRNSKELVGKSCVISVELNEPVLFNNNIARLRFFINSGFVNYYFQTKVNKDYLAKLASSTTNVAAIYLGQLINIPIPVAPLDSQIQIVSKLDELMKVCDKLESSIKQSQLQNEQLLQQVLKEALES